MKRLVIVGGGISGLCAAHEAVRHAPDVPGGLEVMLLEAGSEVGGKARSVRQDGWLVEEGPTGYLDNEPELEGLLQRTGVAAHKVVADQAAARRYLYYGRLRELEANPLKLAGSGILGAGGLLRIAAEPFIRRADDQQRERESIWQFAARRLGPQAADRLIAPMVLGVFAGDANALSLSACFPKLAALEREHGGLIRGMLATRKRRAPGEKLATGPSGKLVSTAEGLQWLTRRLAEAGAFEVRTGVRVAVIQPGALTGDSEAGAPRYRILLHDGPEAIPADAIVLAAESFANADLIERANPEVACMLRQIDTPPVAVVAMGFGPAVARDFPVGFGVLLPRGQGYRILGCIWDSQLFPRRSPDAHLLVRAMIGGGIDPEGGRLDEQALAELTRDELARLFDLAEAPVFTHVARWPRAIPQYDLEHPRRVARIESALRATPGLFLAGNGLHGVAFARSAVTGIRQGGAAARWLAGGGLASSGGGLASTGGSLASSAGGLASTGGGSAPTGGGLASTG